MLKEALALALLVIAAPAVFAAVGHDASQVRAGTFGTGNYVFPQNVSVTGDALVTGTVSANGGNSGNWNTAYGWGNHASAGYASTSSVSAKLDATDQRYNDTAAVSFKAGTGSCAAGYYVNQTTTGGVNCIALPAAGGGTGGWTNTSTQTTTLVDVGIGTASPGGNGFDRELTVRGATNSAIVLRGTRNFSIGSLATGAFTIYDLSAGASRLSIDSSGNVGIGVAPSVKFELPQNTALKLGNAYLSSGGDYVFIANNEWYNGASWTATAAGAMIQLAGQSIYFYKHDAAGSHTTLATLDSAGNFEPLGPVYPGRVDSAPGQQTNWYLGGHGSYGLYTNTGLFAAGQMWQRNGYPVCDSGNNCGYSGHHRVYYSYIYHGGNAACDGGYSCASGYTPWYRDCSTPFSTQNEFHVCYMDV